MKKVFFQTNNEEGMAVVVAILMLALLTIIAVTMSQDTVVELNILRNDLVFKDHLYRAESAAMEGVQWIENADGATLTDFSSTSFLSPNDVDVNALDLNDGRWNLAGTDPFQDPSQILNGYTIVDDTGPIDLSAESNVFSYISYGFFHQPGGRDSGQSMVEVGYKKRF
jgi:Tfp pilus assembly protein PilX